MNISVIMSVHNEGSYINESINSIVNQTYKNFEFLILDDASTDDTNKIIKSIMKADKRIRLYENKEKKGLTENLNFLIKKSKFEIIARMDADDISDSNRFKKQINFLIDNPKYGLVCSSGYHIDDKSNIIKPIVTPPRSNYFIKKRLEISNCIIHGSVMLRKDLLVKIDGYDANLFYAQDYDLWLRLKQICKFYCISERLFKVRIHEKSISQNKSEFQLIYAAIGLYKHKMQINKFKGIQVIRDFKIDYNELPIQIIAYAGRIALLQTNLIKAKFFYKKLETFNSKIIILFINIVLILRTKMFK